MLKDGPKHGADRQMLEHMQGHELWHVPKQVPDGHVLARPILAKHTLAMLGQKNNYNFFNMTKI